MSIRIQCLNIIVLLFTISPIMLVGTFINFPGINKNKSNLFFIKALAFLLVIQVSLIFTAESDMIKIYITNEYMWYIIALIMAPITILSEIVFLYIILLIKGQKVNKITFINKNSLFTNSVLYTAIIGISEELIFRKVWINILEQFGINIYLIVIITAIVYGFNHVFMGSNAVIQKIISGLIYGTLYILSGSIIIPIITHVTQNIIVCVKGRSL